MQRKDWNKIIKKCVDDYSQIKNSSISQGMDVPPRNFIRAWMQTNYQIFKLSGYFYRMFNAYINNSSLETKESLNEAWSNLPTEDTEDDIEQKLNNSVWDENGFENFFNGLSDEKFSQQIENMTKVMEKQFENEENYSPLKFYSKSKSSVDKFHIKYIDFDFNFYKHITKPSPFNKFGFKSGNIKFSIKQNYQINHQNEIYIILFISIGNYSSQAYFYNLNNEFKFISNEEFGNYAYNYPNKEELKTGRFFTPTFSVFNLVQNVILSFVTFWPIIQEWFNSRAIKKGANGKIRKNISVAACPENIINILNVLLEKSLGKDLLMNLNNENSQLQEAWTAMETQDTEDDVEQDMNDEIFKIDNNEDLKKALETFFNKNNIKKCIFKNEDNEMQEGLPEDFKILDNYSENTFYCFEDNQVEGDRQMLHIFKNYKDFPRYQNGYPVKNFYVTICFQEDNPNNHFNKEDTFSLYFNGYDILNELEYLMAENKWKKSNGLYRPLSSRNYITSKEMFIKLQKIILDFKNGVDIFYNENKKEIFKVNDLRDRFYNQGVEDVILGSRIKLEINKITLDLKNKLLDVLNSNNLYEAWSNISTEETENEIEQEFNNNLFELGDFYPINSKHPWGIVADINKNTNRITILSLYAMNSKGQCPKRKNTLPYINYYIIKNCLNDFYPKNAEETKGKWEMPSRFTLKSIAKNREILDKILTENGYTGLSGYWWSSTPTSDGIDYFSVHMGKDERWISTGYEFISGKKDFNCARPVITI